MANISQIKRKKMLDFLETLKEQHKDDAWLIVVHLYRLHDSLDGVALAVEIVRNLLALRQR